MPTYEYRCSKCRKIFEHFQSMTESPLTDCLDESCAGKGTMTRLIGAGAGVIFKGTGFYATDYKKSGAVTASSNGDGKLARDDAKHKKTDTPACESCPAAKDGCPARNKD